MIRYQAERTLQDWSVIWHFGPIGIRVGQFNAISVIGDGQWMVWPVSRIYWYRYSISVIT